MDENCKFCEVVNGKLPAKIVYKDEYITAFLDHSPVFYGHTLVIPNKHFNNIFDVDIETLYKLSKFVKTVSIAVKEAMKSDGVLIIMNNEVSQSVPHLHIHVIPRKFGDGLKGFMWPRKKYNNEEEEDDIASRIKNELKRLI